MTSTRPSFVVFLLAGRIARLSKDGARTGTVDEQRTVYQMLNLESGPQLDTLGPRGGVEI